MRVPIVSPWAWALLLRAICSAQNSTVTTSSAASNITSSVVANTNNTGAPPGYASFTTEGNSTLYTCTSTGIAQASACSSSWTSWSSVSSSWIQIHGVTYTTTTILPPFTPASAQFGSQITLGGPANGSTPYATCGGIPRYSGNWTSTGMTTWTPGPSQTLDIIATKPPDPFSESQPTCCMGSTDCKALQEQWHIDNPLIYPFNNSRGDRWLDGPPASYPHCNTTMMVEGGNGAGGDCSGCYLIGENARIFYWPEPVEPAPACPESYVAGRSNVTFAPNYTATAVVTLTNEFITNTSVVTLTSPTVYMSVQALEGRDGCHGFYGRNGGVIGGAIFPLGPDELSSAILTFAGMTDAAASSSFASIIAHQQTEKYTDLFGIGWQTYANTGEYPIVTQTVPMNIAELGRPPSFLSYYLGDIGDYCLNGDPANVYPEGIPCDTIFDYYHTPQVKLGTLARSMDPLWKTCQLDFAYDPPIALTAANAAAGITLPNAPTTSAAQTSVPALPDSTTPASPCITPSPQTPSATSAPAPAPPASQSSAPAQNSNPPAQNSDPPAQSSSPPAQNPNPPASPPAPAQNSNPPAAQSPAPAQQGSNAAQQSAPPQGSQPAAADPGSSQGPSPAAPQSPNSPNAPAQGNTPAQANTPAAAITVGSSTVNVQQGQPAIIGGQTISAGGSAATIGSQVVSVGSSGVVVDGSTAAFTNSPAPAANTPAAAVTIGGSTINVQQGQPAVIGGQTITPGGSAATIGGQVVSVGSSGVVVDGSTAGFVTPAAAPAASGASFVAGGSTFSAVQSGSAVQVLGAGGNVIATLTNGGAGTTIGGQAISAGGSGLQVGSNVVPLTGINNAAGTTAVVGGQTLAVSQLPGGSAAVVDGSITIASGSSTTVNGQVLSFGSNGLVVGGANGGTPQTTVAVGGGSAIGTTAIFDGQTITAAAVAEGSTAVVDGTTLTRGGPASTINGQVVSLGANGLVVPGANGATTLPLGSAGSGSVYTVNGQTYTTSVLPNGVEVINGSITLTPGGAATTLSNGQVLSAGSSGNLIIGSSTVHLTSSSRSSSSPSRPAQTSLKSSEGRLEASIGLVMALMASVMVL